MLASEYGWAKQDILKNIFFDELYYLKCEIEDRKILNWRMQLAIIQNPFTERPGELWRSLQTTKESNAESTFDETGWNKLLVAVSTRKSGIAVKN